MDNTLLGIARPMFDLDRYRIRLFLLIRMLGHHVIGNRYCNSGILCRALFYCFSGCIKTCVP